MYVLLVNYMGFALLAELLYSCICFQQLEIKNGATAEELLTNKYYDAEAIHFIEKVCIFATLDAQHRYVVRVVAP